MTKGIDLVERTRELGKKIVTLLKLCPRTALTAPLISQLIRSGTSVGANYAEAQQAGSRKDFRHRLVIAKKEANETAYWLEMIAHAEDSLDTQLIAELQKETDELIRIFAASIKTCESNDS